MGAWVARRVDAASLAEVGEGVGCECVQSGPWTWVDMLEEGLYGIGMPWLWAVVLELRNEARSERK